MTLSLALIGCGVMGRRHVLGLKALKDSGREPFHLAAVCDPVPESATGTADIAEELLGRRPDVFPDLTTLYGSTTVDAVDITTAPNFHLDVGEEALANGAHVMVEKPITLTIAQGRALVATADQAGRRLAVAENYRRDPINRLARAALDAGLIGRPFLITQSSSSGGEKVIITPWRHRKQSGGIVVDMGVHYTDLFEYYLGPLDSVGGMSAVIDHERGDPSGAFHPVDAEDLSVGYCPVSFRSAGQLAPQPGGPGRFPLLPGDLRHWRLAHHSARSIRPAAQAGATPRWSRTSSCQMRSCSNFSRISTWIPPPRPSSAQTASAPTTSLGPPPMPPYSPLSWTTLRTRSRRTGHPR